MWTDGNSHNQNNTAGWSTIYNIANNIYMVSLAELQCSFSTFHDGITFYTKHIYSVGSLDKISSKYNGYSYKWKSAVGLEWDAIYFWMNLVDFNPPSPSLY